jgi:hypothetical protein
VLRAIGWTLALVLISPLSHADEALSFQTWKDQQVLEAQNQILRASARITQIKSGKSSPASDRDDKGALHSSRFKKTNGDSLAAAERDLKRGQENIDAANQLQFTDYINVYLVSLQDQPEALTKLAEKMSKDELLEVTKALIRKASRQTNAQRNSVSSNLDPVNGVSRSQKL